MPTVVLRPPPARAVLTLPADPAGCGYTSTSGCSSSPTDWPMACLLTPAVQLPPVQQRRPRHTPQTFTALYPKTVDRNGPVATAIDAMATEHADAQHGEYLQLARTILHAEDDRAMALAYNIVCWKRNAEPYWLVAPAIPAPVRAGHILADGALKLIEN